MEWGEGPTLGKTAGELREERPGREDPPGDGYRGREDERGKRHGEDAGELAEKRPKRGSTWKDGYRR